MRNILPLLLLLVPALSHAAPSDEFESRARPEYMVPFARDLGGLIGATGFHNGRALGFPGFEAGVLGVAQRRPDDDNRILRDAGVDRIGLPMVHVAAGLPWHVDVVAHGMKAAGLGVFGLGARYGILKSGTLTPFVPNIGVSAFIDKANHDDFNARHYAANLAVGWDLPIVQPYVGYGLDWTRVEAENTTLPGLNGQRAWSRDDRFTVGADITPAPFLKLKAALVMLHTIPGLELGLMARF